MYIKVCTYKVHNLIFSSCVYNHQLELNNDDDIKLVCEDMGISVEDDERTIIIMVEDVVSMPQISLPTFFPLPFEYEAIIIDNDIQAPQDSCGTNIANVQHV